MRRLLLAFALTFGMLVLTPSPSWACSCALSSPAEQVRLATTVVSGTVDWTATDGQRRTYKIDVDAVYKGAAASSEKLITSDNEASCGVADLATGKRYLFFIEGQHPGAMRVGLCGGTTAYADALARQVTAITGPPGKPLPAPTSTAGPENGDHTGLVVGLGALVLLLCLASGVAVARRS
ncbi:MAG TPA: hypothetical protein VFE07_09665 [Marmoricola sp.]|nr:hypothetical protein [Marmoricola sp.]